MSEKQTAAPGSNAADHGALWELSHHPLHSAAAAMHWAFDANAHEEHPHVLPRHYLFLEYATMGREMEHL